MMALVTVWCLALSLSSCKQDCEGLHKECLRDQSVTGATLLDCINVYYECAERCPED